MTKSIFRRASFIAAIAVMCATPVTASSIIVHRTANGTFDTRRYTDDNQPLHLDPGEQVSVSDDDHSSYSVTGPGSVYASDLKHKGTHYSAETTQSRVTWEYTKAQARADHQGTTRGDSLGPTAPADVDPLDINIEDLKALDPNTTYNECYVGSPGKLWQYATGDGSDLVLADLDGTAARFSIASGAHTASWPGVTAADGDTYAVARLDGTGATSHFRLVALDVDHPWDVTVATLIEKGCTVQAAVMADRATHQ